jgi:hypothetical protein
VGEAIVIKTEKKMAETNGSSGPLEKERVGQHTLPAAELDALAGQELVTERHLGSPRSVGELETACAMLTAITVHSLSPRSSSAAVHCSGAELDTRPLQFNSQFTDEPNEMSSAVYLSTDEPTSYTILQDMRGYDPGAAPNMSERCTLGHCPAMDNGVNLRDVPIPHRYGVQPTTRLLRGIFVHLEENIHSTEFSDRAPLPGTIPQGMIESVYYHTKFMVYSRGQMNEN